MLKSGFWCVVFLLLSCYGLSNTPHPLTLAWEQALQEGTLLLSRLSALRARVQSRLSLEEAIEHTERVHRGSLRLTPLPTAVPRVFEPGDAHVSLDEYPHLPASVEAAHAQEYRLMTQRVGEAQAKARGQGVGELSTLALPPVPSMTPPQRVAATLGVMVARVRALPLLRLHGVGVTEDFDGRIAFWANNVTLEQLFATAPGWPYSLSGGNQGAGFEGKGGGRGGARGGGKPTPTNLPTPTPHLAAHLNQGASSLLGLAYRSSNVAAAAAAAAVAAVAGGATPTPTPSSYISLDYNLYTGGAPRAKSLLDGIPLLRDLPTTRSRSSGGGGSSSRSTGSDSSGSGRGGTPPLPRTLPQGSPPLGSDFSSAAMGDEAFVLDPEGPTLPLSRRAPLNPHATHRYGILTPIAIAFTPQEARVAALVRVLQGVGLVVAPIRGVYEGVVWVGRVVGRGVLPKGWGEEGGVGEAWGRAVGQALASGVWRVAVSLVGEGRAGALESVLDEVGFTLRWRVRGAWEGALWAGGVVWGTGRELASMVFPEQDLEYRRAEVTALRLVLLHVEGMEREIREHLREGQEALQDKAGHAAT